MVHRHRHPTRQCSAIAWLMISAWCAWTTTTCTTAAFVTPSFSRMSFSSPTSMNVMRHAHGDGHGHGDEDEHPLIHIIDEGGRSNGAVMLDNRRRDFILLTTSLMVGAPSSALAGIDPSALKSLPIEGDTSGSTSRLRQISSLTNNGASGPRPEDSQDIAFTVLPSGEGSYRTYREGYGDATIQPGSKVAVEMTIRCRSFATADEPGGVTYFTTKGDTDFNELAWTIGSSPSDGDIVPTQLEECMMGMKRGSVRRIELPSPVVYAAYKAGRLPLPSEKNKDGKRRFENLWKTDATLLFEVLVTRIK